MSRAYFLYEDGEVKRCPRCNSKKVAPFTITQDTKKDGYKYTAALPAQRCRKCEVVILGSRAMIADQELDRWFHTDDLTLQ